MGNSVKIFCVVRSCLFLDVFTELLTTLAKWVTSEVTHWLWLQWDLKMNYPFKPIITFKLDIVQAILFWQLSLCLQQVITIPEDFLHSLFLWLLIAWKSGTDKCSECVMLGSVVSVQLRKDMQHKNIHIMPNQCAELVLLRPIIGTSRNHFCIYWFLQNLQY